jgi:hypothetical protein
MHPAGGRQIALTVVRTLISPERVKLWDACERDSWKPNKGARFNWAVTLAALKQEWRQMQ